LVAWTAKAAAIEDLPEPPFVDAAAIVMGICFMAPASFVFLRESIFLDLRLVLHAFFEKVRRKRLSSSAYGFRTLKICDFECTQDGATSRQRRDRECGRGLKKRKRMRAERDIGRRSVDERQTRYQEGFWRSVEVPQRKSAERVTPLSD
jgi:hypothetical protein